MNKDNSPERQHDSGMITGKMCFTNGNLIIILQKGNIDSGMITGN